MNVIFRTDDEVDIVKPETIFMVFPKDFSYEMKEMLVEEGSVREEDNFYFKSRNKAIDFLKDNKKMISIADIKKIMKKDWSANRLLNELYPIAWGQTDKVYNKQKNKL